MVAIWWTWLGTYSPQLQVIAALAGVAVAALGVWYARRYVRLTRDLARAVRVQAGEARTAAQAALRQADAALRQADTTQHIFEASNRPYPALWLQEDVASARNAAVVDLVIENVGTVPGRIKAWHLEARLMNLDRTETTVTEVEQSHEPAGASVFSRRDEIVQLTLLYEGIEATPLPLILQVNVEYEGMTDRLYQTTLDVVRTQGNLRQHLRAT
jgi:hypothetical protein